MPLHLCLRGGVLFFPLTASWSQQAQSILMWALGDLGARSRSDCHCFNSILKFYSGMKRDKKVPESGLMSSFTFLLFCWAFKRQYWSWATEGYYLCLYLFILNFHKLLLNTGIFNGKQFHPAPSAEQNNLKKDSFLMFRNTSSPACTLQCFPCGF